MKKHSSFYVSAVMSSLSAMGISGGLPIEQPFKSPRMVESTTTKNTTREQQRRMRQQSKKSTSK